MPIARRTPGPVALRRSSGVYFAVLTLALAELLRIVIAKSSHLGREDGMTGIVRPVIDFGVFRLDLAAGDNLYFLTLALSVAMAAILYPRLRPHRSSSPAPRPHLRPVVARSRM